MLLKIFCFIYYIHLHTIYSVDDYKSLDFLSKIVTSIISDTMVLLMDEILFCLSRHRSLMCYVLYKCTVRIGCTRGSSLFKEVKQHWARLVRGWMTIPGIFFALIPQYLWPVGIYFVPPSCEMELTNFIKKLDHKRLMTSFNRSPYQYKGCANLEKVYRIIFQSNPPMSVHPII